MSSGGKSLTGMGSREIGYEGGVTGRAPCFLQDFCRTGEQNMKLREERGAGIVLGFYKAAVMFEY